MVMGLYLLGTECPRLPFVLCSGRGKGGPDRLKSAQFRNIENITTSSPFYAKYLEPYQGSLDAVNYMETTGRSEP